MIRNKDSKTDYLKALNIQILEISVLSYLLFFSLDRLWEQTISKYLDLNIIMVIAIISAIISSIFTQLPSQEVHLEKRKTILVSILIGVIGFTLLYFKLDLEPLLQLALSIVGGIILTLISFLLLKDQ